MGVVQTLPRQQLQCCEGIAVNARAAFDELGNEKNIMSVAITVLTTSEFRDYEGEASGRENPHGNISIL